MPKTNFKTRVKEAVRQLRADKDLLDPKSNAVYTPMRINGVWKWMAFSEPDGLLVRKITVQKGDPAAAHDCSDVLACVIVESEEATSDSLLNPWGKSWLPTIPNGVWIDINDHGKRRRRLLSVARVLFVTPEPSTTTASTQRRFRRRKSILERVEAAAPDASLLIAPKNDGAAALAKQIWGKAAPFLE